jgi:hypothetical protein
MARNMTLFAFPGYKFYLWMLPASAIVAVQVYMSMRIREDTLF